MRSLSHSAFAYLVVLSGAVLFGQTNTAYQPDYSGTGNACKTGGTCYYIDYGNGSDSNSGTSKTAPWKTAPGMACATGKSASHAITSTDEFILKGGSMWPDVCFPWSVTSGGTLSANAAGYPGVYIGYDSSWNQGTVVGVRVIDPGSCSAGVVLTVSFSGGGGSGAAATANVETDKYAAGDLSFVTLTNAGSGYTSDPAVLFGVANGTCSSLPTANADIYSPVMDGSGTVFGNSSAISPMMTFTSQYGTIDHIEFRNYNWYVGSYSGGSPAMLAFWGKNMEFRNLYVHNFGGSGSVNGTYLVGALNAAQTAAIQGGGAGTYSLLTNSILNNYEKEISGGCIAGNGNSGHCVQNTAVFDVQSATDNIVTSWRGGFYTSAKATSGYLIAGNKVWGILSDANTQHPDSFYLMGGTIAYNNILRDIYPGAAAFYVETMNGSAAGNTSYLFNNVMFGVGNYGAGTSTPPIGWTSEFSPSSASSMNPAADLRAYNNTFYSNNGDTNCINAGQWFGISYNLNVPFTLANNFCISNQSAGPWYQSNDGDYGIWNGLTDPNSSSTEAVINPTAVVESPSTATSQGYVSSGNFAPTSSSASTVIFAANAKSQNLTSLCMTSIGGVSLAPLCYDINGNPRPQTGGWQAGAYQYSASSHSPAPATNLNGSTVAIP